MALTSEDRAWLEERFDRVFARREEDRERYESRMNEHSTKISAVSIGIIKAVTDHEEKHHDPAKRWVVLAAIASIASAIGGAIAWFFGKKVD